MKKLMKFYLGGAILFALPLFLTSCEGTLDDVFGEWSRPSGNNSNTDSDKASGTYIVYTAAGVSKNESIPTSATKWTGTVTPGDVAAGTYVVEGTATCAGQLVLKGEVNLILKDGAKLTVDDGITYDTTGDVGSLNIYAQSTGSSKGQLIVNNNTPTGTPVTQASAISVKSMMIHGGKITATADTGTTPCNVGYGLRVSDNDMIIYDGEITSQSPLSSLCVYEGNLYIHGGTITSTSTLLYPGILVNSAETTVGNFYVTGGTIKANGSGSMSSEGINATNEIRIDGGTVTANGGKACGGIVSTKLTINSGTVIANGGEGYESTGDLVTVMPGGDALKGTIVINGGNVTATGGKGNVIHATVPSDGGNGITGTLTVNGGTLTATGGAGDGTGYGGAGIAGIATFDGGTITAKGIGNSAINPSGAININNGITSVTLISTAATVLPTSLTNWIALGTGSLSFGGTDISGDWVSTSFADPEASHQYGTTTIAIERAGTSLILTKYVP
jgi:hypothetical protein